MAKRDRAESSSFGCSRGCQIMSKAMARIMMMMRMQMRIRMLRMVSMRRLGHVLSVHDFLDEMKIGKYANKLSVCLPCELQMQTAGHRMRIVQFGVLHQAPSYIF